ncbi:MAG TPA: winged helix-turn-helix transcriptional regulator [Planctomycetota bacterium]
MLGDAFRFFRPTKDAREMAVLAEIEKSATVSQRGLARAAGVSATMVNAYIDDLVGRSLLAVSGETNRTYRYHLTPEGAARRAELAGAYALELASLAAFGAPVQVPAACDKMNASDAEAA